MLDEEVAMDTTPFPKSQFRMTDAAIVARQSFVLVFALFGMLVGGYLMTSPGAEQAATVEPPPPPSIRAAE